jgi:hypothetical protein
MRDMLGNDLAAGQLVLWRSTGFVATVIHIDEPTLTVPGADDRDAQIILAVPIPLKVPHGTSAAHLTVADIVRLVNPQQQAAIEGLLARAKAAAEGKPQ